MLASKCMKFVQVKSQFHDFWTQALLDAPSPSVKERLYLPNTSSRSKIMKFWFYLNKIHVFVRAHLQSIPHCPTPKIYHRKMRHTKLGLHLVTISHRNPKLTKEPTFHDVLLSYQRISTADSAQVGRIGCANWLVAQKDIVESKISVEFGFLHQILNA